MLVFKPEKSLIYSSKDEEANNFSHLVDAYAPPNLTASDLDLYPPEAGKWSDEEIEMNFYEKFFLDKGYDPYPVQEEAFERIFKRENVLVTVPTGTGKTMIAKAGLHKALYSNQTAIFTTPLRALTEEKYRELCDDFGAKYVGFATGDYKVNAHAPIQVMVAEILWNRIFSDPLNRPADIVIMDEGHYFNSPDRGYVWEQSIIGLHPATQLVVLSATIGNPKQFCQWCYTVRREPMELVQSFIRRIPLEHRYEEKYLVEVVKELYENGEYPMIIFTFGRQLCFERARLLKSCRKFTSKEEQEEIKKRIDPILLPQGIGEQMRSLLMHGIGIHHAGILPAYKRLVEELTLERLLKVVVSTETISAGINLPAKRVIFPELRKYIRRKARILLPAEYHQMAGRAGRPQFDKEGIAITLAPEDVVQEFRKEIKDAERSRRTYDEAQLKKRAYSRARSEAQRREDVLWDADVHKELVEGTSADLKSHTKITAEQILAIGLPDLTKEVLPGAELVARELEERAAAEAKAKEEAEACEKAKAEAKARAEENKKKRQKPLANKGLSGLAGLLAMAPSAKEEKKEDPAPPPKKETKEVAEDKKPEAQESQEANTTGSINAGVKVAAWKKQQDENLPAYMNLHIRTIIDNLFLDDKDKRESHKTLVKITENLKALGVIDEQGAQVRGELIGELRGIDGPFVYYCLMNHEWTYEESRELTEFLVDHNAIQRLFDRQKMLERKEWIRQRLRERRRDQPQITWEDIEAEYEEKFPTPVSNAERIHKEFESKIPHADLHQGKRFKKIWTTMEEEGSTFMEFVEEHDLEREEGSLFSYLARVMKTAKKLYEVTNIPDYALIDQRIRYKLAVLDDRILDEVW